MATTTLRNVFGNIDHVAIVVENMPRTISWYQRKLGFKVERRFGNPELGVRAVVLKRGTSRIELFEYSDRSASFAKRKLEIHGMKVPRSYFEPGIRHIAFRTQSFGRAVKTLRQKGVDPVIKPKKGYSGDSITFFRDPNGVMLEIVSPLGRKKQRGKTRATRA